MFTINSPGPGSNIRLMKKYFTSISALSILLIIAITFFWIYSSFAFSDRIARINKSNFIETELHQNLLRAMEIRNHSDVLKTMARFRGNPQLNSQTGSIESEQLILELISSLNTLESESMINDNLSLQRRIGMIKENCIEFERAENEFLSLISDKGDTNNGLTAKILNQLSREKANNSGAYSTFSEYLLSNNPELINQFLLTSPAPSPVSDYNVLAKEENGTDLLYTQLEELLDIDQKLGFWLGNGLYGEIELFSKQIYDQTKALYEEFKDTSVAGNNTAIRNLYILLAMGGIVFLILLLMYTTRVQRGLNDFIPWLEDISSGKIVEREPVKNYSEFNEISGFIGKITRNIRQKIEYAKIIQEGKQERELEFPETDELGNAMTALHRKLITAEKDDILHKQEEQKRNWHNEGMAAFGEIFRSERENIEELAFRVIQKLVNYLDASQGSLFIQRKESDNDSYLELASSYAFDRRKYLQKKILPGEGLTGTCALEKETIFLTEIPDDYLEIKSGLGESPPSSLIIVPLKLENELFGVLEIASLHLMQQHEIHFVEKLSESIATTLAAVRINIQTRELLEQSQKQAAEMVSQEEKMRASMNALERAQEESRRKEFEITGILNAVNASAMVAEFSLNGRFSEINEKFASVLQTSREQVIGKHHSEFSSSNKYSDEYKEFWKKLKEGNTLTQLEKFKLFTGEVIWLNQTYTPITDDDGKALKILNIAYDLTELKKLQQELAIQEKEIKRKNLEIDSFSDAVDRTIVRCELSNDGVINHVNENYCKLTGYSSRDLLGKNIRLFLREREKENFENILNQVLTGAGYSGVIRRTKPTGEEVWIMSGFTPIRDETGDIYKIYLLGQDITEKKLKYQLLEEANKEIERLTKELENK